MFELFKNRPRDIKGMRNALLQFIKEQLQKAEGGEGANIRGLYLFVNCPDAEKYLYESALYFDDADRFKREEVQKIADDYAIDLPAGWTMKISFDEPAPPEAIAAKGSLRNDLDPGIEGSGIEPPTGRLRSIKPAGRRTEGSANKDEPARSSEQSASTSTARGSIRSSSAARGCRPAGFGVGTRRMSGRRTPAGHRPPPVP